MMFRFIKTNEIKSKLRLNTQKKKREKQRHGIQIITDNQLSVMYERNVLFFFSGMGVWGGDVFFCF